MMLRLGKWRQSTTSLKVNNITNNGNILVEKDNSTIQYNSFSGNPVIFIPAIITGPSGNPGDSKSTKYVMQYTTSVHTFTANQKVNWSISGGEQKDEFRIDSTTGSLEFKEPVIYSNRDSNIYEVYVTATVAGVLFPQYAMSTQLVIIRVVKTKDKIPSTIDNNPIDNNPPSITGPSGSAGDSSSTKSIPENIVDVYRFIANYPIYSIG